MGVWMSKLDWSRGGAETDPARVQKVADFVTPDNEIISIRPLTPAEVAKIKATAIKRDRLAAERNAKMLATMRAFQKADQERKRTARKLKRAKYQEAENLKAEIRAAEARAPKEHLNQIAAQEATKLARKQTPEHLAALKMEQERIAAAEQERQEALRRERKSLRQQWREKLLNKKDASSI